MSETIVVALGGNALCRQNQAGTFADQLDNARTPATQIADMVPAGDQVAITHGNGPQIGRILRRHERAADEIPSMPLFACGSVTTDQLLTKIGARYGKSPAQVALRWLCQQEQVVAIPKAASRAHLQENLDSFDFRLSDEEMRRIFDSQSGLSKTIRSKLGL